MANVPSSSAPPLAAGGRWAWFGAGAAGAGAVFLVYLLVIQPGAGTRVVQSVARPTPVPLVVQVAGAVRDPGVYRLDPDGRLADAIRQAGGLSEDADESALNLAAKVTDGQRVTIPRRATASTSAAAPLAGDDPRPAAPPVGQPVQRSTEAAGAPQKPGRINLNTASAAELDTLPGVGPVTAQRILEQRQKARFTRVEDLLDLKIVNAATFGRIKDLLTVD
ncbi:MAG: ComEA family DNA-binding protein [Chloroflexi bacterium]|nr:ComEA family DNA-binding protein [Chloroflexota bacterium]